jgi:hypothetical protein
MLGDLDEPFGRSRPAFFPTLDLSRACAEPLSAARRFARGFATRSSVGVRIPYGGAGVAQFGPSTANRCPAENTAHGKFKVPFLSGHHYRHLIHHTASR